MTFMRPDLQLRIRLYYYREWPFHQFGSESNS
jgi:hypothetical protein